MRTLWTLPQAVRSGEWVSLSALVRLLRPHQWTKNVLCFAGAVFGGRLLDAHALTLDLCTFGVFCAISSAGYIFNDIADRERDSEHPTKRRRPIASGAVSPHLAAIIGVGLAGISLAGAAALGPAAFVCVVLYLVNTAVYSAVLKHLALLDVLSVAFGFVLRLLAGVYVLGDLPTAWIVLCTLFLAVFLGFAKRRAELQGLMNQQNTQRPVLRKYTVAYLDLLLNSAATMAVMSYALFSVASGKNPTLVVTLPVVYYAIMHYKRMVVVRGVGDEPDRILLKERRMMLCVAVWLALFVAVEYLDIGLFR